MDKRNQFHGISLGIYMVAKYDTKSVKCGVGVCTYIWIKNKSYSAFARLREHVMFNIKIDVVITLLSW